MTKIRKSIGLILLGTFASISVCGQGLHALPGANHYSDAGTQCHHCHHHAPDQAADSETETTETDSTVEHDCPICRFLALAQLPSEPLIELLFAHSSELSDDLRPLQKAQPLVTLHLARAPPCGSLSFHG